MAGSGGRQEENKRTSGTLVLWLCCDTGQCHNKSSQPRPLGDAEVTSQGCKDRWKKARFIRLCIKICIPTLHARARQEQKCHTSLYTGPSVIFKNKNQAL